MEKVEMMDPMITSAGIVGLKVDLDSICKFPFSWTNTHKSVSYHFICSGIQIVLHALHDVATILQIVMIV